jgi:hypothetical protein
MLTNEISQIITSTATTVITAILVVIGKEAIKLIVDKRNEIQQKTKDKGYNETLQKAIEVWHIVDDKFRITENALAAFGSKEKLFEKILLDRIPGLTQKDINDLRDTISGIINQGRKAINPPADDVQNQIVSLQQERDSAIADRDNMKAMVDQLVSLASNLNQTNNTNIESNTEAPAGPNLNETNQNA